MSVHDCPNCCGIVGPGSVCGPCAATWPPVWPGFTPDTLRDCATILARAASTYRAHPDTVPDSWPVSREWPDDVRARADRMGDVAQFLQHLADEWGDQ